MEQHRGRGLPRLVACDVAAACWVDSGLKGPVLWAQGAGAEVGRCECRHGDLWFIP